MEAAHGVCDSSLTPGSQAQQFLQKGWFIQKSEWSPPLEFGSGCAQVADIIAARAALGKNYGVILIPEGLLEHVPEVGSHTRACAC